MFPLPSVEQVPGKCLGVSPNWDGGDKQPVCMTLTRNVWGYSATYGREVSRVSVRNDSYGWFLHGRDQCSIPPLLRRTLG